LNTEIAKNCIVVCGPTASGKTSLGVSIANRLKGEIISADSRQVYRTMDIGTGKDLAEYRTKQGAVSYHLIDIADPSEIYTLYKYKLDFKRVYNEITGRGAVPIIVGGTGLYIEAVLNDYQIPSIPEDPELREELMKRDKEDLEAELKSRAPHIYETTDCSSKKRIIRALEIASNQSEALPPIENFPKLNPLILCTRWDRKVLWKKIDKRVDERLKHGMVNEVRRLLHSGISRSRFSLFGMEYKHIARYVDNEIPYNQMVAELKINIHQLAKRQETWFRGMERRGFKINWIDNSDVDAAIEIVKNEHFESQSKTDS
jgi:tRNA dimethylallyltransferase